MLMLLIYFVWSLHTVIIDDCGQFFKRGVEVVIDHQLIEFRCIQAMDA